GNPRTDVPVAWTSDHPSIATVDAAGLVSGIKPGKATIRATTGQASSSVTCEVVQNPVQAISIEPASIAARTGVVVRFAVKEEGGSGARLDKVATRWAVSGQGASSDSDGVFVAERPGTCIISASVGDRTTTASAVVSPRNVDREIQVVGRAPVKEFQAGEQWII